MTGSEILQKWATRFLPLTSAIIPRPFKSLPAVCIHARVW